MTEIFPELFNVYNHFYLGNYTQVVSEASSIRPKSDQVKLAKDVLTLRAHVGLEQYSIVISEVSDKSHPALQAVKILASYLSSPVSSRDVSIARLENLLGDSHVNDPNVSCIAATIYAHEGEYEKALKAIKNPFTLEMFAIQVSLYIKMNRIDLAGKAFKEMQKMDDEATITLVAGAMLGISSGTSKGVADAESSLQELAEKFGDNVITMNGRALCLMQNAQFEPAEKVLLEAMSKRSNDPETLINLIVCSQHLSKPREVVGRYISQLKASSPNHIWVKNYINSENSFDKLSKRFQATTVV